MTLPHGFTVRLAQDLVTTKDGDVLVGGSPLSALRLSPTARQRLAHGSLTVTDSATAHLARRLLTSNLAYPDLSARPAAHADELTVVIPVRDRAAQLDRALIPLAALSCIVVDDASHEPTSVADVAARHGAELVTLDVNGGPAAARNAGLRRVRTPYVAFVDSDVQVSAAALLRLTRHFADPDVALVGPRVLGRPTTAQPRWFERYDAVASSLTLGRTPSNVRPGAAVAWLPSACLVGRVDALGDGFDPAMRVGEDVDLVWRLVEHGRGVRYDPDVTAHHETRTTIRGWLGRKFAYGGGGAPLAVRHGDKVAPAVLTPLYAAAGAAVLAGRPWSALVAAGAVAAGTRTVRAALPDAAGRTLVAARVSARGLGWAVRQEAALALRHWWPATAVGVLLSSHVRRVLPAALLVDTVVALAQQRHDEVRAGLPVLLVGRRLDDLAYGAGLWYGAARYRSLQALRPRRPGHGA
jgi:mycofactocin system glycosyltransferase